jgi:hypothetical protein
VVVAGVINGTYNCHHSLLDDSDSELSSVVDSSDIDLDQDDNAAEALSSEA